MSGLVIVTGGSRGIGAATCRRLARDGYAVAVNYASEAARAEAVAAEIVAAGGRAAAFRGDVSVEADVLTLFAAAQDRLGALVGLVNNAGIMGGASLVAEVDAAWVRRVLEINVLGTVLCAREAVRIMSTRHGGTGGAIVNLSSAAARLGGAGENVHYALSKGAIDTFTTGLGREVAAEGVRVNAVAPGLTATDMAPPERIARMAGSIPMQRAAAAEEIAEAIAWLLSPAASYVTATVLGVTGGR